MSYSKYLVLFLIFILSDISYAQQILKVAQGHVLIDIDQSSDLRENDEVKVYKKLKSGKIINVAIVRIIFFEKRKCISKIIAQSRTFKVAIGDFIKLKNDIFEKKEKRQETRDVFRQRNYSSGRNHFLSYLSVGTGIVASGLGYYFLIRHIVTTRLPQRRGTPYGCMTKQLALIRNQKSVLA